MRLVLSIFGALLIGASPLLADEIILKNGSVIQGRIVREERDLVTIDLGRGRMSIARRDIVSIKRAANVPAGEPAPGDEPAPPASDRAPRGAAPAKAAPKKGSDAEKPAAQPRKRKTAAGGPKVVPVERVPSKSSKGTGPDSAPPSRKAASRTTPAPNSNPDW